jgi:putative isomerase
MDITLLSHTDWRGGQLLAYSGLDGATDYRNGITGRTAMSHPAIEIKLPGSARLEFSQPNSILLSGDFFELQASDGAVRGAFVDAWHLLIEGPCRFTSDDPLVASRSQGNRLLVGSAVCFNPEKISASLDEALAGRKRWLELVAIPPGLSPAAARAYAKALSIMKTQVYTPEGQITHRWTTPDRWPHRGMWLWDSVFHAIGWRHIDLPLAREMIQSVLEIQDENGFIAHAITPFGKSSITQPPILALGVKQVYDLDPQPDWLALVYPRLCAYIDWDLYHRDSDDNGLLEWFIEADENSRSGESGMDNSPRFDTAAQLDAVDFNAYVALECEILSEFTRLLGHPLEVERWEMRRQILCHLINERLWSRERRFYVDYDVERQVPSDVLSSAGFLPLICGAPSIEQAQCLVQHLSDPSMFGTPLRVPSIAVRDAAHYAKDMWRGPVWVNVNWLVAHGLERYRMHALADSLRRETCAVMMDGFESFGTFFEFYDDRQEVSPPALLRKGKCAPHISPFHQVFHDYGWTAALYCDWMHRHPC